jgi:hypothetical protein
MHALTEKINGVLRCGERALSSPAPEPTLAGLYHDDEHDSRGPHAAATDAQRPRRVDAVSKWGPLFVRCREQVPSSLPHPVFHGGPIALTPRPLFPLPLHAHIFEAQSFRSPSPIFRPTNPTHS